VSAKNSTADRFVSIAEAAEYLGVSVRTVRNLLYENRIRGHKLGPRIVRIRLSDIDAALTPYAEAQ